MVSRKTVADRAEQMYTFMKAHHEEGFTWEQLLTELGISLRDATTRRAMRMVRAKAIAEGMFGSCRRAVNEVHLRTDK